jgi:hypothetical protein
VGIIALPPQRLEIKMSRDEDKIKHSRRIHQKDSVVKNKMKIAKA